MLDLTSDQERAQEQILSWLQARSLRPLTVGGYAGTGKTTVIAETLRQFPRDRSRTAFCCFTGKAASELRKRLVAAEALLNGDYCGTIHGLIYSPVVEEDSDGRQVVLQWERKPSLDEYSLIVIDEASMVSEEILGDLLSYGIPILAVGDHGQLPPVHGRQSLLSNPDVRLEKIHRQAEGDPIIRLSIMARETGAIPLGRYGAAAVKTDDPEALWRFPSLEKVMFLCGYNTTRVEINKAVRARLGDYPDSPVEGDRVICLRNYKDKTIFNGMLGIIKSIRESDTLCWKAEISMDSDIRFKGPVSRAQFGALHSLDKSRGRPYHPKKDGYLFDWGYALTVHKAQGSESEKVVLIEERLPNMTDEDWRRWLYTGVTRASSELTIIGSARSTLRRKTLSGR